ncbi:MAG: glycosyltransferase family 39 protein [Chloroflexi bacterium]|nr:glycosyltransferase family 39 protein [Chloroflexota bacterium]
MSKDPADTQRHPPNEDELIGANADTPEDAQGESPDARADSARIEPDPATATGENTVNSEPIEDLTLSELIVLWLRAPATTWRRLRVAMASHAANRLQPSVGPSMAAIRAPEISEGRRSASSARRSWSKVLRQRDTIQLLLSGAAIVCALIGSVIVRGADDATRAEGHSLIVGGPYLWLGFLLWLVAEATGHWTQLKEYWRGIDRSGRLRWAARALPVALWINALKLLIASMNAPSESATDLALEAIGWFMVGSLLWFSIEIAHWQVRRRRTSAELEAPKFMVRQPTRPPVSSALGKPRRLLIAFAILCSLLVWANTTGNRIEPPIILLWLISAVLWGFVFAPLRWNLFDWASDRIDALRRIHWRAHRGAIIALALVLILGAAFRFNKLDAYPPQMFSDLVEKIQDAYKIHHHDDYRIFFENIGGREPLHFYLLSILASQPGMEFDHYALKLMSAIESFLTLPIVFWLGVEVMGKRRRRFGLLFGALAAALVAVSFWHVVIGRQGMRISLAPLFSALTALYLVRALRQNRRPDYVKAGLALGFGLMGYQAVRMLPLAAVAGVAIALVLAKRSWRQRLSYLVNLAVLAFVSLMVFLPLLHYWMEAPENYMRRTSTRIFGDLPTSDDERASFLAESIPILLSNIRKTALIYHYYGDSAWVSGVPHEPAMDPVTAAFMCLGAAAWLALIAKTRDPVDVFVPFYLLVTLLPTALALSFPIEVPSFVRASGAIPPSYLIAALPAAVFCRRLCKKLPGQLGLIAAAAFAGAALLAANHYNSSLYFGGFTDNFDIASHPHAQAGGLLRGFAESDGAYGNAFVLTSPHWWDTRAVGIEAGLMFWDSDGEASSVPQLLYSGLRREAKFRLQPERDLLFFYARHNERALQLLSEWFPNGRQMEIEVQPLHKSFYIYRAPALGADGLLRFLDENWQT